MTTKDLTDSAIMAVTNDPMVEFRITTPDWVHHIGWDREHLRFVSAVNHDQPANVTVVCTMMLRSGLARKSRQDISPLVMDELRPDHARILINRMAREVTSTSAAKHVA